MTPLWRMVIVLSLALLTMRGASAHEHAQHSMSTAHATHMTAVHADSRAASQIPLHCSDTTATSAPCRHDHSICCTTACGVHCGALFIAFRFEPRASDSLLPRPFSEPRHDGVTHAPPLRPPI